jgi:hypothetical protein
VNYSLYNNAPCCASGSIEISDGGTYETKLYQEDPGSIVIGDYECEESTDKYYDINQLCLLTSESGKVTITIKVPIELHEDRTCPINVTPTLHLHNGTRPSCLDAWPSENSLGTVVHSQVCVAPGCTCVLEFQAVYQFLVEDVDCCNVTPRVTYEVEGCCAGLQYTDLYLVSTCEAVTPLYEASRNCETGSVDYTLVHQHCAGSPCTGDPIYFHDRLLFHLADSCPSSCYCVLFHLTGTCACMESVIIYNSCTLVGTIGLTGDYADSYFVLCYSVPYDLNLDLMWKAAKMCDDPGCSCDCHPTVDMNLNTDCYGCCCCFSDEYPSDYDEETGITTIPLIGCDLACGPPDPAWGGNYSKTGPCSGKYYDTWKVCMLGPSGSYKVYRFILKNSTCCTIDYDVNFTNNGLGVPATGSSGTLLANESTDILSDDINPLIPWMTFFEPGVVAPICDCGDPDGYCREVWPELEITWTCDPDCCDDSMVLVRSAMFTELTLLSGFTTTVIASQDVSTIDNAGSGIDPVWDSGVVAATPWCGAENSNLYKVSGQFSGTLLDTLDVSGIGSPSGISWDGDDTFWSDTASSKLWRLSGQFTSTVHNSLPVTYAPQGVAWDGTNTIWPSFYSDPDYHSKLVKTSGKFSSTVLDSLPREDVFVSGVTFDTVSTIYVEDGSKLLKLSGQFTSTVLDSIAVTSVTDISNNALNFD